MSDRDSLARTLQPAKDCNHVMKADTENTIQVTRAASSDSSITESFIFSDVSTISSSSFNHHLQFIKGELTKIGATFTIQESSITTNASITPAIIKIIKDSIFSLNLFKTRIVENSTNNEGYFIQTEYSCHHQHEDYSCLIRFEKTLLPNGSYSALIVWKINPRRVTDFKEEISYHHSSDGTRTGKYIQGILDSLNNMVNTTYQRVKSSVEIKKQQEEQKRKARKQAMKYKILKRILKEDEIKYEALGKRIKAIKKMLASRRK